MFLVDSSVWVLLEHGRADLRTMIPPDTSAAICPVVMQEVLRGTRDRKRYAAARDLLMGAVMLDAPTPLHRFEEAARLYLVCRNAGITPSSVDSLVAACAIAHGVQLLHRDSDFDHIARVTSLLAVRV